VAQLRLVRPMARAARILPRNQHRLLGCMAVVHSAAIIAFFAVRPWPIPPWWFDPLWVGIATLWFFWPIVLLLHVGRSLLRVTIPLIVTGVIAVPWWRFYRFEAAPAFGLPMGCPPADQHDEVLFRLCSRAR
jgi:hypothetical protein